MAVSEIDSDLELAYIATPHDDMQIPADDLDSDESECWGVFSSILPGLFGEEAPTLSEAFLAAFWLSLENENTSDMDEVEATYFHPSGLFEVPEELFGLMFLCHHHNDGGMDIYFISENAS